MTAFDPKKFTTPSAKPLPLVLLLDVSASMSGEKINTLNSAVSKMITNFSQEEKMETEIHVSIITFGGSVNLFLPYTKASGIEWKDMTTKGNTPMGTALEMAKAMIEDKEVTLSRAYRPTIILVSDGEPTDSWEKPLKDFISEGRSSKCDRMAMAIGSDANTNVLQKFIEGTENPLFESKDSKSLHEFFRFVTMSTVQRTHSKNPNEIPSVAEVKKEMESLANDVISNTPEDDDEILW